MNRAEYLEFMKLPEAEREEILRTRAMTITIARAWAMPGEKAALQRAEDRRHRAAMAQIRADAAQAEADQFTNNPDPRRAD